MSSKRRPRSSKSNKAFSVKRYLFDTPNVLKWESIFSQLSSPAPTATVSNPAHPPPHPMASTSSLSGPKKHKPKKRDHAHGTFIDDVNNYMNHHMHFLNNSKVFAGCVMILLNVGAKFIQIQFSKSMEEYLKMTITKEVLVFAMAWMGTRDVFTAFVLTTSFVVFSEFFFNEESEYCIIPHQHRILHKMNQNGGIDSVSEEEISKALSVLEKLKKEKYKENQNLQKQSKHSKHGLKTPSSSSSTLTSTSKSGRNSNEFEFIDGFNRQTNPWFADPISRDLFG